MTRMPNARARTATILCACLLGLAGRPHSARADEPMSLGFVEAGRATLGFIAVSSNFAVGDFDGDGIDDVAFCAASASTVLIVAGRQPGADIGFKQTLALPDDGAILRVGTATNGTQRHLFTVAAGGKVRDYGGWPLQEVGSYDVGALAAATAGDLYAGGEPALVTVTATTVDAYVLAGGEPLWSYPFSGGTGVALAQLDADPASEVVINAPAGRVIDGATLATDWQYAAPFGAALATGHLAGDGTTQFLASGDTAFTVFRGAPWMPLWSAGNVAGGIAALATADLDHNGRDTILEGDAQWGAINAYDASTHQLRFSIANPGWGVAALAAPDLDGDGTAEIAFANFMAVGNASIEAVDSKSGAIKWTFAAQNGLFAPVAIGDVDGDGQAEIVVADGVRPAYAQPGVVSVFDAASGGLEWQSPAYDAFGDIAVRRVVLRPHAGDAAMDIVLAGNLWNDGKLVVLDGASHALKWQVYGYFSGPLAAREVRDARLVDFDDEGTDDVVVASHGAGGALLQVFSGIDGHVLWTSPAMPTVAKGISSVLVHGAAPNVELVAVLDDRLVGYSVQNPGSPWTLGAASDGAAWLPGAGEFALFGHDGTVAFYAAADRAFLHACVLPAPLDALDTLDGGEAALIGVSADTLILADGANGRVVAGTPTLGANLGFGNQLAATAAGNGVTLVVAGDSTGVYRYLIEMTADRLMQSGFELN